MKYASQTGYTESRSVLIIPVSKPGDCKLDLQSKHWLTSHTVRGFHQSSWAQLASTQCRNWKMLTNVNDKWKLFHKAFNDGVRTGTLFSAFRSIWVLWFLKARRKGRKPTARPRRRRQDSMEVDWKKQDVLMWDPSGKGWRPMTGTRGHRNEHRVPVKSEYFLHKYE